MQTIFSLDKGVYRVFRFYNSKEEGTRVGTKGVSQLYHLSFDDNKVLKIINWIC